MFTYNAMLLRVLARVKLPEEGEVLKYNALRYVQPAVVVVFTGQIMFVFTNGIISGFCGRIDDDHDNNNHNINNSEYETMTG